MSNIIISTFKCLLIRMSTGMRMCQWPSVSTNALGFVWGSNCNACQCPWEPELGYCLFWATGSTEDILGMPPKEQETHHKPRGSEQKTNTSSYRFTVERAVHMLEGMCYASCKGLSMDRILSMSPDARCCITPSYVYTAAFLCLVCCLFPTFLCQKLTQFSTLGSFS